MVPVISWLILLAVRIGAPAMAEALPAEACPYGCVESGGERYALTRDDVVWLARAAQCEVGDFIPRPEAQAALWALVQNHQRQRAIRPALTLAGLVIGYSACCSPKWATGGPRAPHPRITPRADETRALRWRQIPRRTRAFVVGLLRGHYPNRWPGYVYVFTAGYEGHADRHWDGPYYVRADDGRTRNAYWRDPSTAAWTSDTVRIIGGGSGLARLAAVE
uniref:Uncharacterized protein n=1 Tax=viral metagenome TaxID=1070528 RepID=A0A6M3XUT7_9ZZZZ